MEEESDQAAALAGMAALGEVLDLINRSTGDPTPIFAAILDWAHRLCGADVGQLMRYDGRLFHNLAIHGFDERFAALVREPFPPTLRQQALLDGVPLVHIHDAQAERAENMDAIGRNIVVLAGIRTFLMIPLQKDGKVLGTISAHRTQVHPFSDRQIALLQNFAAQAVIAIENARLITEQREALERQTATADVLGVINANSGDLAPVFDTILEKAHQVCGAEQGSLQLFEDGRIRAVAVRGLNDEFAAFIKSARQPNASGPLAMSWEQTMQVADMRTLSDAEPDDVTLRTIVEIGGVRTWLALPLRRDNVVLGRIVAARRTVRPFSEKQIALLEHFAAQAVIAMENARLLNETRTARDEAETALADLRRTQDRLVQTEKMASLGQLTAGIAHEIKNPLNFVNNFSDLSVDLVDELNDAVAPARIGLPEDTRAQIDEITGMLKGNLQKIAEHGRRADSIVRNMLEHSRTGTSERRAVNFNNLAEEALNLAYHGARAEFPSFNIMMEKEWDPTIGEVELYPQEFTRVLLNLISNGFYATRKRAEQAGAGYEPVLRLSTRGLDDRVEIAVRDNGTGMPANVREKIFEPFFTTKPAGEGTGLGLSLSFDIVVKQHGGQLAVRSEPGSFTEFTISIPRQAPGVAAPVRHANQPMT